jgi:hypothetical protein
MDLCKVFDSAKLLFSILIGAKNSIHKWILISKKFYQKIDEFKILTITLIKLQFQLNTIGKIYQS